MGIHWKTDRQDGLLLGEMVGVRILQQGRDRTNGGRLLEEKGTPYTLLVLRRVWCC